MFRAQIVEAEKKRGQQGGDDPIHQSGQDILMAETGRTFIGVLDCAGKRSATALFKFTQSGMALRFPAQSKVQTAKWRA
jgi:hypothetical protein